MEMSDEDHHDGDEISSDEEENKEGGSIYILRFTIFALGQKLNLFVRVDL